MTKKSYLVTGGTGFIGASLVTALVNRGHKVRTLDNNSRGAHRRLASVAGQYEHVEGDIRDYATFAEAAKGIDCVCHLAYINGTEFFYSMPETVLDVGVKGIVNAIDVCKNLSIPELIVASSSEVYQTPPTVPTDENVPLVIPDVFNPRYSYAAGKIISEVMAIHCGAKFFERMIIFRPHNIYGPDMGWEHVIPQLIMRAKELSQQGSSPVKFPIQGTGNQTRAFCFIDDMINALMTVFEHGKHMEIYNIGTDQEVTISELTRIIGHYFKCELDLVAGDIASGGTLRRCPDISKIRAIGFEPQVNLVDGVRRTADWYDANQNLAPAKSFVLNG
ncbi:MAG: NAD-dependent epimerase/dehydratase family protein [Candidatus Obscuribacterales bacterium]|nr:NAD-dependent epimerase/dehydratase family protein [Candidatus Obscuribacterales bacterium]